MPVGAIERSDSVPALLDPRAREHAPDHGLGTRDPSSADAAHHWHARGNNPAQSEARAHQSWHEHPGDGGCGRARNLDHRSAPSSSQRPGAVRDLPPAPAADAARLSVGQASPPFGSQERKSASWSCAAATIADGRRAQCHVIAQNGGRAGQPPRQRYLRDLCATRWSTIAEGADSPLAVALGDPAGIGPEVIAKKLGAAG